MEYDWGSAYRIIAAMEKYPGPNVPSPDVELDEETGLPPPPPPPRLSRKPVMARSQNIALSSLDRVPERASVPPSTNPKSWIGEMDRDLFLAHTLWLKEERFITTKKAGTQGEHPDRITAKGVQLLREIEAIGGWDDAVALAQSSNSATTLTSLLRALQKAKPRTR